MIGFADSVNFYSTLPVRTVPGGGGTAASHCQNIEVLGAFVLK